MSFKLFLEQEWKRDMGMPNQIDNPTMDQALNNTDDMEDSHLEPKNADPYAIDNIHAIENHLRALSKLVMRITKSKKFFGMEHQLQKIFDNFKDDVVELINHANSVKVQQPQVNQNSQGIPLNQQISPEITSSPKGDQHPRMT